MKIRITAVDDEALSQQLLAHEFANHFMRQLLAYMCVQHGGAMIIHQWQIPEDPEFQIEFRPDGATRITLVQPAN